MICACCRSRHPADMRAPIPSEYRTMILARLRHYVHRYRSTLRVDVEQTLLDAACELEESDEASLRWLTRGASCSAAWRPANPTCAPRSQFVRDADSLCLTRSPI